MSHRSGRLDFSVHSYLRTSCENTRTEISLDQHCQRDPFPCLSSSGLEKEGLALLGAIQGASAGESWVVLLDMAGTNDFGATYP